MPFEADDFDWAYGELLHLFAQAHMRWCHAARAEPGVVLFSMDGVKRAAVRDPRPMPEATDDDLDAPGCRTAAAWQRNAMKTLSLIEAEIAAITEPLQQPAAQARALRAMGFTVKLKPNGRPLVSRANFETVMGGSQAPADVNGKSVAGPNESALMLMFDHKGDKRGPKAQGKPARTA